ncbi:MAG: hypothetical protein GY757_36235, partial [bacterium]|nr:hypothetical protein [bacterium]
MRRWKKRYCKFKIFAPYLGSEIIRLGTYVNALFVGAIINFFTLRDVFGSVVPYLVPVFVQVFSRSSLRYVNRFRERLMELPVERPHPVFIMDCNGDIVLSGGHTRDIFDKYNIKNISEFIGDSGLMQIFGLLNNDKLDSVEVYSSKTKTWFEARAKIKDIEDDSNILVWFDDISERKILDSRICSMLNFSDNMLSNLDSFIRKQDTIERLAMLIIDTGYEGVFIAKSDKKENLDGITFKKEKEKLSQSKLITIEKNSPSSIYTSRQYSRVIFGDMKECSSNEEFFKKYPFDQRVKDFLDFPIQNFVSYNEGGFFIEAFNKSGKLNRYDSMLVETLLNHTRSMVMLIDLAEKNDEQFLQKVIGLCAAAEYSDEITGKHIFRINEYARFLAEHLGLSADFIHTIG